MADRLPAWVSKLQTLQVMRLNFSSELMMIVLSRSAYPLVAAASVPCLTLTTPSTQKAVLVKYDCYKAGYFLSCLAELASLSSAQAQ